MSDFLGLMSENGYFVYPKSVRAVAGGRVFVACKDGRKFVGVEGGLKLSTPVFEREEVALYELSWENYLSLCSVLPIRPSVCDKVASVGTGDRLGLGSAAHLTSLEKYPVFPVIAQQSPRELVRTDRTFNSVLLDAVMGWLESGYAGAFGADADHIKDEEYLRKAAEIGYSMYTLDVSDWLLDVSGLSPAEISEKAAGLLPLSKKIISECAGMKVAGTDYVISDEELTKSALIYEKSMEQIRHFDSVIREYLKEFNLEVSIDEGTRDTTPEDHLFSAEYLRRSGVDFWSVAPKFPGEFQKGVDYIGDMSVLSESMKVHAAICRQLKGYRISLHSGSDKFSIYPMFGKVMDWNFHLKTSGSTWLQAIKLIARADVPLFTDLYKICLDSLVESKKAYHVYITPSDFPATPPADVLTFFDTNEVRQLFHISYGVLLELRRTEMYEILRKNEKGHYDLIIEHFDRHLDLVMKDRP